MKKVYDRLKDEYLKKMTDEKIRLKANPIKNSFSLNCFNDVISKSVNVMSAQTENGIFTKIISIDDITGKTNENIIYTDNQLNVYTANNINLTAVRCALMACLAVDLNFRISKYAVIGFIGTGKINIKTCEMLYKIFGINKFIIRGSSRNRAKNKQDFSKYGIVLVDKTDDLSVLNNHADVVITCTNSCLKSDLISNKNLNKPKLIISQDGGYILDQTIRENRLCYSDHVEQIEAHYKNEFPFDNKPIKFNMMKDTRNIDNLKYVNLYGIALADAIVYEEMFLV